MLRSGSDACVQAEMVSVLLEVASVVNADLNDCPEKGRHASLQGQGLLAFAAERGRVEIVKRLLQERRVDINARDGLV